MAPAIGVHYSFLPRAKAWPATRLVDHADDKPPSICARALALIQYFIRVRLGHDLGRHADDV